MQRQGLVKWFDAKKGFGFIASDDKDYFVHFKEIQSAGYKSLTEGDKVMFEAGKSSKGDVATKVVLDTL